jgi:hypothetical protein
MKEKNNVKELIQGYQGGIKIKDFCDVTPCGLLIDYKRLERSCCFHLQGIVMQTEYYYETPGTSTKLRNVSSQKNPTLKETSKIGRYSLNEGYYGFQYYRACGGGNP